MRVGIFTRFYSKAILKISQIKYAQRAQTPKVGARVLWFINWLRVGLASGVYRLVSRVSGNQGWEFHRRPFSSPSREVALSVIGVSTLLTGSPSGSTLRR